jgi:hypothetical protein
MRDLDALLNSLVKIDRNSLVTILSSESRSCPTASNLCATAYPFSAGQATRRRAACRSHRSHFAILPVRPCLRMDTYSERFLTPRHKLSALFDWRLFEKWKPPPVSPNAMLSYWVRMSNFPTGLPGYGKE